MNKNFQDSGNFARLPNVHSHTLGSVWFQQEAVMRFGQLAVAVWVMAWAQSARAVEGTCQCCLSVIAGSSGSSVSSGTVRGPCGRPMSMAKVIAASGPVSQAGSLAPALPVAAPTIAGASVNDNFFDPTPLSINVGDTVKWSWLGFGLHSVTSVLGSPESFNSGDQSVGSFSHTFTHVGVYIYYCDQHGFDFGNGTAGGMFARINVKAVPEPVAGMLLVPLFFAKSRRAARQSKKDHRRGCV